jgi:hypothetical protein
MELAAWDALAGARRAEMEDVDPAHYYRQQPADGAGKLAGQEPDVRARGACRRWERRAARAVASDVWALCRPGVARFAERSCAGLADPAVWAST